LDTTQTVLHECAHATVAVGLGYTVERIEIRWVNGFVNLVEDNVEPLHNCLIAAAGVAGERLRFEDPFDSRVIRAVDDLQDHESNADRQVIASHVGAARAEQVHRELSDALVARMHPWFAAWLSPIFETAKNGMNGQEVHAAVTSAPLHVFRELESEWGGRLPLR
jgi:hypothetical protein